MCLICSSTNSSRDEIAAAEQRHRTESLHSKAAALKELIGDCKNIIRINTEAGIRDLETERYLKKLVEAQYELSREM